jgi:hypothetical protein
MLRISNLTMPLTFNHLPGASPTSEVLGPPVSAGPQQQEAFMLPYFTFGSGSPPNTEAEQQAMDCYKPSQHDDLANAFSSAFNSLSLRDDHPGSSATAVEVSSLDTGNVFLCSACSGTGGSPLFWKVNYLAVHSPLVLNILATFLPFSFRFMGCAY